MEAQTALVRTNGTVELYPVANIHLYLALVVYPGHTECDDTFWFVWTTPIYYYEMSGQMKTMIDRANSLYPRDYKFRDVYLLSVAAEDGDYVDEKAAGGVQGWVDCFEKAEFKGKVFAGNVNDQGDIEGHKALNEAYELGKSV